MHAIADTIHAPVGAHYAGTSPLAREARFVCPKAKAEAVPCNREIRVHMEFRKETGDLVFVVRDHRTGETIRQFPPEALLEARHQMEALRGMLVNELA